VDDMGPVLLRSNQYINVDSGVFMLSFPSARFDSLTCLNNEVMLTGMNRSGFSACDVCATGPSATITNFTALNNIVRYAGWALRPGSSDHGLLYSDMRHAVFGNNVIALGNLYALRVRHFPAGLILPPQPAEDCDRPASPPTDPPSYPPSLDILLPNYKRAWFNNRDLSGTLLEVRFWNSGIDGLASQQQWPE